MAESANISVAIVGAGISGIVTALALKQRGIQYSIYEQAHEVSQYGAGLSLNPAGLRALRAASSEAYQAYLRVRIPAHPTRDDFFFSYSDGDREFECTADESGSLRRAAWIGELVNGLPPENVSFNKRLASIEDIGEPRLRLVFEDGTQASADIVIGCDGLKSKLRGYIVGHDHPSAMPTFSHHVTYRSILSRDDARRVMGPHLAECAHFRSGKGICYVCYPISGGGGVNNLGLLTHWEGEWPHFPMVSAASSKQRLLDQISDPFFRDLIDLLPNELDVWAVYDTMDHPLPTYSKDRLALVGDSAHASSPYLGAGASMAIEDVVVLVELLTEVSNETQDKGRPLRQRLERSLEAYSETRMERSQWLVQASREAGELNCQEPLNGKPWSFEDWEREMRSRYKTLWDAQIGDIVDNARKLYHA